MRHRHQQARCSPGEPGAALREDLYYRLAVVEIEVPPLRARRSDIPLLVAHALRSTPARAVSEEAMELLLAYDWPGNVRELIHVIERASVLCGGEIIDLSHLPPSLQTPALPPPYDAPNTEEGLSLREAVAALERRMIVDALDPRRKETAPRPRVSSASARTQLYAKIEEHGIVAKVEG